MENEEVKGMRFTCSERWEDMRPMGKDRFCMSCQKPVIDFTDWERDALIGYFKERPDACGQFRAEQVDPTLIPLPTRTGSWRTGLVAAIAALAINTGSAQELPSSGVTTEQVPVNNGDSGSVISDKWGAGIDMKEDGPYCVKIDPVVKASPRYRVFLSGQFPFLHIRQRLQGVKNRITGCPSF